MARSVVVLIPAPEPGHTLAVFVAAESRQVEHVVGTIQDVEAACVGGVGVEYRSVVVPIKRADAGRF